MEQLYTAIWTAEDEGKTLYYLLAIRKNIYFYNKCEGELLREDYLGEDTLYDNRELIEAVLKGTIVTDYQIITKEEAELIIAEEKLRYA
jgi:hypothetical protein